MPATSLLDILLRSIANLPPAQICKVEAAITTARRRAEAVVEINAIGDERRCPRCSGHHRSSWGTTRAGARRWRCKDCELTWTGRTGTPLSGVHRPGLFLEVLRNMLDPNDTPLSCRKLAHRLGVSRDTIWRWRMIILEQIKAITPTVLSGIIETDETFQRESRKGSREWVRHRRDPLHHPKPPRRPWYEYPKRRPPQAIARAWSCAILGVVDRSGKATFQHIKDTQQPTIEAALVPQVAPDAIVLFDGAPQYEAIAKARGITYEVLIKGRRGRRTPKAHHLNSVNNLHFEWKDWFRKIWRGPATKNLDGYTRWMAARWGTDPVGVFRSIIA